MSIVGKLKSKLTGQKNKEIKFTGEFPFFDLLRFILENTTNLDDFEFLQIGAADGVSEDPIFELVKKHHLKGSLVEASPSSFEKLKKNYEGHSNLKFRNVLVSDQPGHTEMAFYEIKPEFQKSIWTEQCSSLSRQMVLDSLEFLAKSEGLVVPKNLNDAISETLLPAIHIDDLLHDLEISRLDLLLIDTMGHDAKILKAFPFDRLQPAVIMFEHYLHSNIEKVSLMSFLGSHGYAFAKFAVDTIAIKSDMARKWSVDEW